MAEGRRIVLVESPYRGYSHDETPRNVFYARLCFNDSLIVRGEIPFASHLLFTQTGITDDSVDTEREVGMRAGWAIGECACLSAFYTDFDWSSGMIKGLDAAIECGRPFEERSLGSPEDVALMIESLAKVVGVNNGICF